LSHGGETAQEVQNSVGLALLESGRMEQARLHFQEAIRLEPRYGDAHNSLGTLLARLGQFSAAKAEFAESSRLTPEDPTAHNNLGNILLSEGKVEAAIGEYAAAVRLDPESGGVARLDDLLLFRRSSLRPRLVPLIRAAVANPRDQTALQELERALIPVDKSSGVDRAEGQLLATTRSMLRGPLLRASRPRCGNTEEVVQLVDTAQRRRNSAVALQDDASCMM
jgi:tetratricopeptide (TPR) repeat protein